MQFFEFNMVVSVFLIIVHNNYSFFNLSLDFGLCVVGVAICFRDRPSLCTQANLELMILLTSASQELGLQM